MLMSHINAIEKILVAQGIAAQNAGHPSLRGWPRECFVRDFLSNHLPSTLEIGHGEIIDEDSAPEPSQGDYRPEVDVVLYRRDLPKIAYSSENTAYLAEGVLATLEVKSKLTRSELKKACEVCIKHKRLKRNPPDRVIGGYLADSIMSYVIAYDCETKIPTVAQWLSDISQELNENVYNLVDIVVVLGQGVIWQHKKIPFIPETEMVEEAEWVYFNASEKNLFLLFTHMMMISRYLTAPPDTLGYGFKFNFEPYGTA